MAGRIVLDLGNPALDASSVALVGSKRFYYANGTTTLQSIFTDPDLDTPLANPMEADSAGRFPDVWCADDKVYSVAWKTAAGATIRTFDNIKPIVVDTTDLFGEPGVYYLSELTGVVDGTDVSVTALNGALATVAATAPGVVKAGPHTYTMDEATLVLKEGADLEGQGKDLTEFDWSDNAAFSTLISATGAGPGTWFPASSGLTKGRTSVAVTGTPTGFVAGGTCMVRSTEFGLPQINDQEKFTWAATTSIAKGALTYANGRWYVCTTAGTTGSTSPTSTSNPVTDGTATLYYIDYANQQNQVRWTAGLSATLGMFRAIGSGASIGYLLVCVTAGTTGASAPVVSYSNTLTLVTDGTAVWRLAGYFNSTKGELKERGIDRVSGSTIYLTSELEDDYPLSYGGQSFTVEIAPVTLANINLSKLTIRGRGIPASGSLSAVGSGTSLYYTSSELCDKGILPKWCKLTLRDVRIIDVEQFAIYGGCSIIDDDDSCEYIFSPTHLESQQYACYLQGAGSYNSRGSKSWNARHVPDGDGSPSTTEPAYRGIPSHIGLYDHDAVGCWQSVTGSHRAARYLEAVGGIWNVLTAGWKSRCPNTLLVGVTINGPRYASESDYIAQDALLTGYYQTGKSVVKGVILNGGFAGARLSNADGTIGKVDWEFLTDGALTYGARLGAADGDAMEDCSFDIKSSGVVTYDNVLVDGPMTNCHVKLRYKGGRKGITSANRKPKLTNCTFDISGQDCTEEAMDLYNATGGHVFGGVRASSTTNVINRLKDFIAVTIDRATAIGPAAFAGEFWKVQATSASYSSYIEMADQVCYSPSGIGGTGLTVEANVSNSSFGRINTTHTTKISAGVNPTNIYASAPNNVQDAAYTLAPQDATPGRTVTHTSGSAHTWTINPLSTGFIPVGSRIEFCNVGSGVVTIARGAGVVLRLAGADANRSVAQYGAGTLVHVSTDVWIVYGSVGVT